MRYFTSVSTLEELRKQYKALLKKHHPDNHGSEEATKEINAEYDKLFKELKNRAEGQTSATSYDFEADEKLREVLNQIIAFEIDIEIIGSWIWCTNCYSVKEELKKFGFKWAAKKKAWYFHAEPFVKKSRKSMSLDDIRDFYGSQNVKTAGHFSKVALPA